jgi:hypothetical protein
MFGGKVISLPLNWSLAKLRHGTNYSRKSFTVLALCDKTLYLRNGYYSTLMFQAVYALEYCGRKRGSDVTNDSIYLGSLG